MKNIWLIIALFSSTSLVLAQSSLEKFQKKYQNQEGIHSVTISGDLFKFSSSLLKYSDDKDSEALSRICSGINSMQVFNMNVKHFDHMDTEIKNLKNDLSKSNLNLLMTVKERDETVDIYSEVKDDEIINGLVLLIKNKDEFTLLEIRGKIHIKDLSILTENHSTWH